MDVFDLSDFEFEELEDFGTELFLSLVSAMPSDFIPLNLFADYIQRNGVNAKLFDVMMH